MAGTLVVDTLKSSTTGAPTFQNTSGTQVGTLCRAWVNFTGSTATINASFNVSSVTRNSTGNYTLNLTNAMIDANYSCCGSTTGNGDGYVVLTTLATSSVQIITRTSAALVDPTVVSVAIFR